VLFRDLRLDRMDKALGAIVSCSGLPHASIGDIERKNHAGICFRPRNPSRRGQSDPLWISTLRQSRLLNVQLRRPSCHWRSQAKRTERSNHEYQVKLQLDDKTGTKGPQEGHGNVPSCVLAGFNENRLSLLERMAGTRDSNPAVCPIPQSPEHASGM
jgi:hypothetical protein